VQTYADILSLLINNLLHQKWALNQAKVIPCDEIRVSTQRADMIMPQKGIEITA